MTTTATIIITIVVANAVIFIIRNSNSLWYMQQ